MGTRGHFCHVRRGACAAGREPGRGFPPLSGKAAGTRRHDETVQAVGVAELQVRVARQGERDALAALRRGQRAARADSRAARADAAGWRPIWKYSAEGKADDYSGHLETVSL